MKSLETVINNFQSNCIDGRDFNRLANFVPTKQLEKMANKMGGTLTNVSPDRDQYVLEWTRENILSQLEKDVNFGFEKALDKRGISANMMYEVVKMWCGILEEGLENFNNYEYYGLPLFKAVAEKYGFHNPIGCHEGNEDVYAAG